MAKPRSRLHQRTFIALAISAAFPNAYAASVARVVFASGDVSATDPGGARRALARGAEVNQGDLVATNEGRAQLRFTDGAHMSLQPRTDLRVDDYRFEGKTDGSENAVFSLLKGGMRTITGAIGRTNRPNYQMKTLDATIGIRGTEYVVSYGNSITLTVGEGATEVCNPAGCLTAFTGETIFVANAQTAPVLIDKKTELPPARFPPPLPEPFMITENRQAEGGYAALTFSNATRFLAEGTATYNFAFAHNVSTSKPGPGDSHVLLPTSVTLDSLLRVTAFQDTTAPGPAGPVTWSGLYDTAPGASGNDGIIAWNRWLSGTTGGTGPHSGRSIDGGEGLHYAVGVPTPQSDMDALRTANISATYTFLGATRPTSNDSSATSVGTLLPNSNLFVNFGASQVTATLNVLIPARGTYNVVGTNLPIAGSGFSSALGGAVVVTGSGICSSPACSAIINGLFAGRNAARAGVSYSITEDTRQTAGAAAFSRPGF